MLRLPRLRLILLALIALGLGALGLVLYSRRPHQVASGPDVIRVLFIGNSYTYVNNLPGLLMELSAHELKRIDVQMIAEGGATLEYLWEEGKALSAIQQGHWDYIVLQEQSTLGSGVVVDGIDQIGDPTDFYQYARQFDSAIQKAGAKTIFYLTWARQNAPQNQTILTGAYEHIASQLHSMVAPVGLAWQLALKEKPGLVLYQDDGSHPSSTGSYLAACVFYATIYGKSPEGLPTHVSSSLVDYSGNTQQGEVNLDAADALFLQQVAWQAVSAQRQN